VTKNCSSVGWENVAALTGRATESVADTNPNGRLCWSSPELPFSTQLQPHPRWTAVSRYTVHLRQVNPRP